MTNVCFWICFYEKKNRFQFYCRAIYLSVHLIVFVIDATSWTISQRGFYTQRSWWIMITVLNIPLALNACANACYECIRWLVQAQHMRRRQTMARLWARCQNINYVCSTQKIFSIIRRIVIQISRSNPPAWVHFAYQGKSSTRVQSIIHCAFNSFFML